MLAHAGVGALVQPREPAGAAQRSRRSPASSARRRPTGTARRACRRSGRRSAPAGRRPRRAPGARRRSARPVARAARPRARCAARRTRRRCARSRRNSTRAGGSPSRGCTPPRRESAPSAASHAHRLAGVGAAARDAALEHPGVPAQQRALLAFAQADRLHRPSLGSRMRRVVDLREVLEVELGVDLRRRDVGVAEQFLHRAQVAAGLQQVRGERVAQHVRVHVARNAGLHGARLQAGANLARRQPGAVAADEERGLLGLGQRRAAPARPRAQPARRCPPARCAACCLCPAHAPLRRAGRSSRAPRRWPARPAPPVRRCAGRCRRAVRRCRRRAPRAPGRRRAAVLGQRHRMIDRQGLGQRLGRLGRAHAGDRIERDLAVASEPAVQAAPRAQGRARCCAARGRRRAVAPPSAAPAAVAPAPARSPRLRRGARGGCSASSYSASVRAASRRSTRRCSGGARRAGRHHCVIAGGPGRASSCASPALAISPTRTRKSVPMSAL